MRPDDGTLAVADYFTPSTRPAWPRRTRTTGPALRCCCRGRSSPSARKAPSPCSAAPASAANTAFPTVGGIWSAETTWAGRDGQFVYTAGEADHLKAWRLAGGRLVVPAASRARPAPRAYSAGNLSDELYNTQQDASRDAIPGYDNFCVPTVTDGRVFVGTKGELIIYGLLG
jgi:hypothetical protein